MGKQVAIAIGVKRAGKLAELPGAVNGAKEFHAWAERQRYDAHLVTDEAEPVTVQKLKGLIKTIIDDGEADRLLIYFAGHGIQPSVNTTFWLLSRWEDDSDEAVNVNLSFANAKRSGIGQIAVFSDACRSTVKDAAYVGGASIFPKPPASVVKLPQWDHFLASRLGEVAQEVPGTDATEAYGIFTRCVMQALSGAAESAIESRPGKLPPRGVTSAKLATFLEDTVPLESGKTPGAIVQFPEVNPGWRSPEDVYIGFDQEGGSSARVAVFLSVRTEPRSDAEFFIDLTPGDFVTIVNEVDETWCRIELTLPSGEIGAGFVRRESLSTKPDEPDLAGARQAVERAEQRIDAAASKNRDLFAASEGRESFETRQGLTIIGANPVRIECRSGERAQLFRENDIPNVRGFGDKPQTIMIELDGGNWIGACIIPQFVGTVVVKDGAAASVNYAPARGGAFPRESFEQIAPVVNRWMALMHQGRFGNYEDLKNAASILRQYKHQNPSLGVLAAYAYERAGDIPEIDSIIDYFLEAGQPVPFDVAMLSTKPIARAVDALIIPRRNGSAAKVAGSFPLMTQGWSFLDPEDEFIHPAIFDLRRGLLPSLWTTFRASEGAKLAGLIHEGEL